MGSGVARLIAHSAFWGLLTLGFVSGELGPRLGGAVLFCWLLGFVGLAYLPLGDALFPSYVAVLDIVLVLVIVKGDVRLN